MGKVNNLSAKQLSLESLCSLHTKKSLGVTCILKTAVKDFYEIPAGCLPLAIFFFHQVKPDLEVLICALDHGILLLLFPRSEGCH